MGWRSVATKAVTKETYVATCQYLLLCLMVATVVIAVAGVARLDIVAPRASTPTNQAVPTTSTTSAHVPGAAH